MGLFSGHIFLKVIELTMSDPETQEGLAMPEV
jgi:hypothetical protein